MDTDQTWATIHHERARLVTLLESLRDDEWNHPSLCAGWRVRDVAAHVISSAAATPTDMMIATLKSGGSFNRTIDREARRDGARPPEEILATYRAHQGSRRRPFVTKPLDPLLDVLVHSQDIAIPLGREHPMPPEPARLAADFVHTRGFPFHARRRFAGIRFVATDVDFTAGDGDPVQGPIAAILLTLTGRSAGLTRLRGPGIDALWTRCG